MHHNPVQFISKGNFERLGIFMNTVNADEQITRYNWQFRIIKGDNVRIIIMLQILLVHLKQLLIIHENESKVTQPAMMKLDNLTKPIF